jgi:hypothetical protein
MFLTYKQYLLFFLVLTSSPVPEYLNDVDVSYFFSRHSIKRQVEQCRINVVFDSPKVVDIIVERRKFTYVAYDLFSCFDDLSRRLGFEHLCPSDWPCTASHSISDMLDAAIENHNVRIYYHRAVEEKDMLPCFIASPVPI